MPPMQPNGLAKALKMLLSNYKGFSLPPKSKKRIVFYLKTKKLPYRTQTMSNPIHKLFKGLSTTLSQITKKPERENYDTVIKSFLPSGSKLLIPKLPTDTGATHFFDIDGDSQNELIATYKLNDEIKTFVLKRQNKTWQRIAEVSSLKHDTIDYMGFADITGKGKKQLLIGLTSIGKAPTLYGYSYENNNLKEIFSRSYHRFELLNALENRNATTKKQLAIWNKKENDTFSIEVLDWNGTQFEQLKDTSNYHYKKVVPYYVQKIKRSPNNASSWYNLAEALVKGGSIRDAAIAIKVGMSQNPSPELNERLLALKNGIIKQ